MNDETLYSAEERLTPINERLTLLSRRRGLTFGTDSYLLAALVRACPSGTAAELGGGTGVISLLCLAREKFARILCAEIQPEYADLIRRNAALNGFSDRLDAWEGDIRALTVRDTGGEVHAVFSNPPYLRAESGLTNDSDEMNTARREENGTIRDFALAASRLLRWGGTFSVVYRPDRLAELTVALREAGLEPKRMILVHPTPASPPSLVLVEAKKGAGEGLTIARPLFVYPEHAGGAYTPDMQAVYDNFTLAHLFAF
ncbi:MAG: methyltransferase [Clostridiales bacterium]|nr:methyltransferase [Clostridiales bacterium]